MFIRQNNNNNNNKNNRKDFNNPNNRVSICGFSEKRLPFKIEYEKYGSLINSDHLIRVSVFVSDEPAGEYYKADKNIVLDKPEIEIKVWIEPFHLADIDQWICHLQTIESLGSPMQVTPCHALCIFVLCRSSTSLISIQ